MNNIKEAAQIAYEESQKKYKEESAARRAEEMIEAYEYLKYRLPGIRASGDKFIFDGEMWDWCLDRGYGLVKMFDEDHPKSYCLKGDDLYGTMFNDLGGYGEYLKYAKDRAPSIPLYIKKKDSFIKRWLLKLVEKL
jgi:hypothetical protein